MITIEVFIIILLLAGIGYWAANTYVRRSLNSFQSAEAMLSKVRSNVDKLIDCDVPAGVARVGFMLAATAGCGCYVRGVLLVHYLPAPWVRAMVGGRQSGSAMEHDLDALDELTSEQRRAFSELIASVIIYDGYRNPLSGWAFRRMMRAYTQPTYTERSDAEITAVSIVSRKRAQKLPKFDEGLCPA